MDYEAGPDFSVMGGEGMYTLESIIDGAYYRYYDSTLGDEEVQVWRSDQGYACEKKYCCLSLDTVLRATRYFCEHGGLDPAVSWQLQSHPWQG